MIPYEPSALAGVTLVVLSWDMVYLTLLRLQGRWPEYTTDD